MLAWLLRQWDGIVLLLPRIATKAQEESDGMDLTLTDEEDAAIRKGGSLEKVSNRYPTASRDHLNADTS